MVVESFRFPVGLLWCVLVLLTGPLSAQGGSELFVRGDANSDGFLTLSDVFAVLRSDTVECRDAADVDDNGELNRVDALYLIGALFFRHGSIPAPFVEPGPDPTADQLDCRRGMRTYDRGAGSGGHSGVACEDPRAIADLEFIHFRRKMDVLAGQQRVRVPVVMNSPVGDVEGLTLSFHAPPEAVRLEAIDIDDSVYDRFGVYPEWVIPYDAQRSEGYLALTVVNSLGPPFDDALLPEFHDGVVAHLEFSVSPDLSAGTEFRIQFRDIPAEGGAPPIRNELSREGSRNVYGVCDLSVRVVDENDLFIRGDANRDWLVNVSDVVAILSGLFAGSGRNADRHGPTGPVFPCLDAADLDDNGRVQQDDATYLASYLFQGGRPPLSPFPQPGKDSLVPEREEIGCGE